MLYLKNITDDQDLFIPRDGNMTSGLMELVLKSTIDQETRSFQVSSDRSSGHYFKISVTLQEEMPDGEYEYILKDGQIILSSGLLILGDGDTIEEYNKKITYEQYRITD